MVPRSISSSKRLFRINTAYHKKGSTFVNIPCLVDLAKNAPTLHMRESRLLNTEICQEGESEGTPLTLSDLIRNRICVLILHRKLLWADIQGSKSRQEVEFIVISTGRRRSGLQAETRNKVKSPEGKSGIRNQPMYSNQISRFRCAEFTPFEFLRAGSERSRTGSR